MPSGTTLRFAALVALAVATTLQIFGQYATVWPTRTSLDDARCQVRADLYLTSTNSVDPDAAKWSRYRECMAAFLEPRLAWLAGGLLLLFGVAAVIYFARPRWRIRRSRLVPLPAGLEDTLAELVERAGLRRAPEFVLDPYSMRAGGVAFGHHRRKIVCLDAGLVMLHRRDPASFRAIVLHELAHVRADVTTTYATLAVWRAFLGVVLVPYLLTLVNPMLLSSTPWKIVWSDNIINLGVGWRLGVMVVLMYLARTAVLRSREKYADALVVQWTGDEDPYRNLVPTRTIRRWLAIHPTRAARQAAMREPKSLLRPGFWEVLASALALQIAWWHAVTGLRDLTWYRDGNESFTVMRIVWTVAVTALVGSIAWRGAAAGSRRFAVPGLALGIGFVLGDFLDAQSLYTFSWLGSLAWLVLIGTAVLVCCWAGYCATLVTTRGHAVLLAAATAVVAYSVLGWFPEARAIAALWRDNLRPIVEILHGFASSTVDRVLLDGITVPFLLNFNRVVTAIALCLVWLVPLVLRRELPRAALAGGGLGGLCALVVLAVVWTADSPPAALVRTAWGIALVFLVQLVTAFVVARRSDRIGALLAAWMVGLIATVGLWWSHLDGTRVDSVLATRPLQVLPFLGTAAALLAGGVTHRETRRARPWGAIAIAAVSVGLVWWWPKAPNAASIEPPPLAAAELNHDQAVNIWIYGGGWDTFMSVVNANTKVFEGVQANDVSRMTAGCAALLPVLKDAAAFPKPPEDGVRANWSGALTSLELGARSCLANDSAMGTHFLKGLDQLKVTQTALVEAQKRALS
ncbi:hypothetical protein Lesp02_54460 [Lentzea sp. NBRC 105346]|nr:hypothetical protein Lesp02_54460 [Lentzea sp. NBRC 105346]